MRIHANSNLYDMLVKEYYIENISAKQYQGDAQVWCIEEGDGEDIFVASAKSLSVYNGVAWRNYQTGYSGITRWLAFDEQNKRLYAAIDNRFGVWVKNRFGEYVYTNLYQNSNSEISEIFWRVFVVEGKVYFQTQKKVYCYDIQSQEISVSLLSNNIEYMHQLGKDIYVQSDSELLKLVNGQFVKTGLRVQNRIISILDLNGRLTIVTENEGVFHIVGDKLKRIESPNNALFIKSRLFSCTQLSTNTFALGSVLDGVFIVNDKLEIIEHINFESNLKHTTVLSLKKDRSDDIWLGLDGGLARAKRNPTEIVIHNSKADIGTVYDATWLNNQLYVATNKGLYAYKEDETFTFIEGSQGQVWSLAKIDNMLIVCHDAGLFQFQENSNRLVKISNNRVWNLKRFNNDPKKYLSLDFNQTFSIYENTGNTLVYKKEIENLGGAHTSAFVDRFGHIWVQDRAFNPIRIGLRADDEIEIVKKYHLPEKVDTLRITEIDNDIIFYGNKAAYIYDIGQDSLRLSSHYTDLIEEMDSPVWGLSQLGRDDFFYASKSRIGRVKRSGNDFYNYGEIFQALDTELPRLAHRIIVLDNTTLATGILGGISFHFVKNQDKDYLEKKHLELSLVEYEWEGERIHVPLNSDEYEVLESDYSSLYLHFQNMYAHHQIEYSIDNGEWILSKGVPYLELEHLGYGAHTIRVRNVNFADSTEASFVLLKLHVNYPWFLSPYFLIVALLIIVSLGYFVRSLFKRRLAQQYEKVVKKQIDILQKEKSEHDLKMLKVRLKDEEKNLVNLTMENVKRNAMLNDIRLDADLTATELSDNKMLQKKLKHILKRIDFYLNSDDTQDLFEKYFNAIHDGFYDRLLKAHPDVTRNDMKLCAYIKLNLNTKEIAAYMNIAPSSVEVARYRLRKKLNLEQEISLQKYISEM